MKQKRKNMGKAKERGVKINPDIPTPAVSSISIQNQR
jgi:hypothetical protein